MEKEFNIWEGIYESFTDSTSEAKGLGFNGDVYNTRVLNAAQECLSAIEDGKPIPYFHKQRNTLLPPIVGMMLANMDNISILDLGGGLGIGYMTLMESIPEYDNLLYYTIVEVNEVCEQGRNLFSNIPGISFLNSLPEKGNFDLVHSSSVLQYFENWQDIIKKFTEYSPEYISLADVFAGDIPTFVTLQNYYESRMQHWFLNLDELLAFLSSIGYKLIMKTFVNAKRLDMMDTLPMNNFPEAYRLNYTLHLLFKRVDAGT